MLSVDILDFTEVLVQIYIAYIPNFLCYYAAVNWFCLQVEMCCIKGVNLIVQSLYMCWYSSTFTK